MTITEVHPYKKIINHQHWFANVGVITYNTHKQKYNWIQHLHLFWSLLKIQSPFKESVYHSTWMQWIVIIIKVIVTCWPVEVEDFIVVSYELFHAIQELRAFVRTPHCHFRHTWTEYVHNTALLAQCTKEKAREISQNCSPLD